MLNRESIAFYFRTLRRARDQSHKRYSIKVVFVRNREMGPAQKNYNKIPYQIARSVWELFHINRFLKKLCLFGTGL